MTYYKIFEEDEWLDPDTKVPGVIKATSVQGGRRFYVLSSAPIEQLPGDGWLVARKGEETNASDVLAPEELAQGRLTPAEEAAENAVKEAERLAMKGLDVGETLVKIAGVGLGLIFGIELVKLLRGK